MNMLKNIGTEYLVPAIFSAGTGLAYLLGAPISVGAATTVLAGCSLKAVACKIFEKKGEEVIDKSVEHVKKLINRVSSNYILGGLAYTAADIALYVNKNAQHICKENYQDLFCMQSRAASALFLATTMIAGWELLLLAKYLGKEARGEHDESTTGIKAEVTNG